MNRIKPTGKPTYRMVYDGDTKKVITLVYGDFNTASKFTIFTAATYAEIQAEATAKGLTGLPAKKDGEP